MRSVQRQVKLSLFVPRRAPVKDIPGYRSSGKIGVASRRVGLLQYQFRPLVVKKNTNHRFLRLFVSYVPLFRSLMLTPM